MGNFIEMSKQTAQNAFSGNNIGGTISGVAGGIGNIIGTAKNLSEIADTSDIRNQAEARAYYNPKAQSNEELLNEWSSRGSLEKVNYEQIRGKTTGEITGGVFGAIGAGASTGLQVGGPLGALAGAIIGGVASGIGAREGNSKARKEVRKLNKLIDSAEQKNLNNFINRASYIDKNNDFLASYNSAANGGQLDTSIFSNDIIQINSGGLHSTNPNGGIQVGIDKQGIPNLVEEGEVIWNDYVFSNRLRIPKSIQNKYKLKDMTFAEAVKKIQKESEERPNDPISKEGLIAMLTPLMEEQENIRQKKEMDKIKREFSKGGKLNNLFEDGGPFLKDVEFLGTFGDYSTLGDKPKSKTKNIGASFLRYAPAIGSAIGAIQSLISKPDYSNAEKLEKAAQSLLNYKEATYKPLGDFMEYTPFDKSYYTNKLQAESNALRRAIINQGGPSVNAALLAADYNAQTKLGELFRQAEEYNVAQKQKVKEFNRGTKAMNAEMLMKASLANQEAKSKADALYLQGLTNAINMREALANADATSDSQALSNLFTNLGNIGIDAQNIKDVLWNAETTGSSLPLSKIQADYGKAKAIEIGKQRGMTDEETNKILG